MQLLLVLKGVYSLPFHKQAEEVNRRNQLIFLVIGLIMAIPSIYAGYDMTIKYSESNHMEQFIKNDINQEGRRQVIDYSLDQTNKASKHSSYRSSCDFRGASPVG